MKFRDLEKPTLILHQYERYKSYFLLSIMYLITCYAQFTLTLFSIIHTIFTSTWFKILKLSLLGKKMIWITQ